MKNKWIGWVENSDGHMVRFIGPTSRAWAQRKVKEAALSLGASAGEHTASDLEYACRTKFANFGHANSPDSYLENYYSRLPIEDLNLLISVIQG